MNCPTCSNEVESGAQFCGICGTNLSSGEVADGPQQPMVGFGEAISRGFNNYFKFSGRATRAEYWFWVLFTSLVQAIPLIGGLIGLACLIPSLAVTSRRLHDIGKTGWWQLCFLLVWVTWGAAIVSLIIAAFVGDGMGSLFALSAIAFIAAIAATAWMIVWLARQGDTGSNKYGPDPRTTPRS